MDSGTLIEGGPRWVGRVALTGPAEARFTWQGAGLIATVRGSSIAVTLQSEGVETVFFQPRIDGQLAARFEVKFGLPTVITLASGLEDTLHEVELYRDTEGDNQGISSFLGFAEGELVGAPAGNGRLIEVIGDSISAGYGSLGSESHVPPVTSVLGTPANSSWYHSYGAVAGHALSAEVSTIARAGWGMLRGSGGNEREVLPRVYERVLADRFHAGWQFEPQPAAVVLNLGTNDWGIGDPGVRFEQAYEAFLVRLRARYPRAWLLLTCGSMLQEPQLRQVCARLQNVADERMLAGDEKVATFDLGSQDEAMTGCGWHPNVADHRRMAGILERELRSRLGW